MRSATKDDEPPDPADPAVPMQQLRDERGRDPHQRDRQEQPEDQHHRLAPRRAATASTLSSDIDTSATMIW